MNDCISYGFSVPLVAATISSVTPLPNYFSSSPTSGMWVKTNNPNLTNLRLAGLLGTSPRPEVVLNMILGSAVLAASQMRVEFRTGIDEKAFNKLMKIWPKILEHGFGQLKTALQSGLEANKLIEETLSLPISEVFSSQSHLKK
jgi:hypothetical protein